MQKISFWGEFFHSSWTVIFSNYNVCNITQWSYFHPNSWDREFIPGWNYFIIHAIVVFFADFFVSFFVLPSWRDENYFCPGFKLIYNHWRDNKQDETTNKIRRLQSFLHNFVIKFIWSQDIFHPVLAWSGQYFQYVKHPSLIFLLM